MLSINRYCYYYYYYYYYNTMFKGVILLTQGSKCSFFKGISLTGVISRLPLSSETLQREYCISCTIYNPAIATRLQAIYLFIHFHHILCCAAHTTERSSNLIVFTDNPSSPGEIGHTTGVYVSCSFRTVVWVLLRPTRTRY